MSKQKKVSDQNKPILIAIAILVLLIVLPIALSYSNFYPPFLDKKVIYLLDSVVADIPLLPKTPKQIVTKSLIRNQNLNSYSLTTNLFLGDRNVTLIKLTVNQAVENAGSVDTKSKLHLTGDLNILANGKVDIETVKLQNNLNFKIGNLPSGFGINTGSLNQGWYQVDLAAFQEGLSVNARNDQQIIDDVRNSFQKTQSSLVDNSIFSKVTSFKVVKLNNQNNYEIKFALSEDSLKNLPIVSALKLKNPVLTLLVNCSTYYLTKIDLSSEIVLGNQNSQSSSANLTLRLSSELSKISQSQNIVAPTNQNTIKSPIDLALDLNPTDSKTDALFAATAQAKDLGENFLTVERLSSVILLLPKSI